MLLDCTKHETGVRQFLDYYQLPPRLPGKDYLEQILAEFSHLPYENISKIVKWHEYYDHQTSLRLPEEVISDHIDWRLGGTCFSLTFFLQSILTQNGFNCYPVMADMQAGRNIHCALIVILLGQKYLVDPGYLLNQPLLIDPQHPRLHHTEFTGMDSLHSPQLELRYQSSEARYHLYTFTREQSKWRYSFSDQPASPAEFLQHWQASFQRNSMHGICLTKVQKNGLIYIHKHFMRETNLNDKKNYNIRNQYHNTIRTVFGIDEQWVEHALAALTENLKRESALETLAAESQQP